VYNVRPRITDEAALADAKRSLQRMLDDFMKDLCPTIPLDEAMTLPQPFCMPHFVISLRHLSLFTLVSLFFFYFISFLRISGFSLFSLVHTYLSCFESLDLLNFSHCVAAEGAHGGCAGDECREPKVRRDTSKRRLELGLGRNSAEPSHTGD